MTEPEAYRFPAIPRSLILDRSCMYGHAPELSCRPSAWGLCIKNGTSWLRSETYAETKARETDKLEKDHAK